jgi:DNA-binding transcriptional LysR family regulator
MSKLGAINLNRLFVFVAVAENGSLTAAAGKLGIAKTMVSTHVQRLEAELGVSLFTRTTRKITLTEAGQAFYAASRRALHDIDDAVLAAGNDTAQPRGTLRVTAPIDYGTAVITPLLIGLQQRYPALRIELQCVDRRVDLIAEGLDVAIRLGGLADSTHRATRVGGYTKWLVASPQCLERHGTPRTLAGLDAFPFISLSVLAQPLLFHFEGPGQQKQSVRFNETFSANTANACRAAALAGGGLAMLTDFSIRADVAAGRLIRVLPKWAPPRSDIHAVFPTTRYVPSKVRAFIDAIKASSAHRPHP